MVNRMLGALTTLLCCHKRNRKLCFIVYFGAVCCVLVKYHVSTMDSGESKRNEEVLPCSVSTNQAFHPGHVIVLGSSHMNSDLAQFLLDQGHHKVTVARQSGYKVKKGVDIVDWDSCHTKTVPGKVLLQDFSHLVLLQDSFDTVHEPSMCLVNLLETINNYSSIHVVVAIAAATSMEYNVAAKMLEYTVLVYRSVYKLNATVAYIPHREVSQQTAEVNPAAEQNTPHTFQLLSSVLQQKTLCDKYSFSAAANNSPAGDKNATAEQRIARQYPSLPLDVCMADRSKGEQCLDNIIMHQWSADKPRPASFHNQENYVFSTYFTSKNDPQRGKRWSTNDMIYILNWYLSVKSLGLKAVLFHDGLSPAFMKRVQADYPHLLFHKVTLGGHSINDERYYIYLKYLLEHPYISKVLMTDVSDVIFKRNPFELMTLLGDLLYIGVNRQKYETMDESPFLRSVLKRCKAHNLPHYDTLKHQVYFYNAGVIGGERATMIGFLSRATHLLQYLNNKVAGEQNCNMVVVNYVAHRYYSHMIFANYPLQGIFLKPTQGSFVL